MFRIIPKFEDNARITGFSQTVLGKLVLLAIFGLTLSAMGGVDKSRLLILAFLSAITFLPKIRRFLVLACTVLVTNFFGLSMEYSIALQKLRLSSLPTVSC